MEGVAGEGEGAGVDGVVGVGPGVVEAPAAGESGVCASRTDAEDSVVAEGQVSVAVAAAAWVDTAQANAQFNVASPIGSR
jgi:hypothetical protein